MRKPTKLLDADQSEPGSEWDEGMEDATPKHSLKIFKADQTHRFLLVNKDTIRDITPNFQLARW